MFAERDKHYPSRSGQTSLATAVTNITKPVTKNNFVPSTKRERNMYCLCVPELSKVTKIEYDCPSIVPHVEDKSTSGRSEPYPYPPLASQLNGSTDPANDLFFIGSAARGRT